ncbi:nucleotidyl transferase AbiEii/AbiGii toxin family protein [Ohessyouella blattaphilus]|uniref:Nucleotidyl transferase AbiEii/AbiGii toxin family protein n=1 Tax=Ohessyouella blattaphilus TaxID=2949333 RepID=A0ABT1EDY5_9FIRM|nr:nucleotidyl transferase AbiEii/AbiGii toxin family protein [Ohessyouella blattaphilus]MCP1108908.1 nucleotidyl transferase AbiEii/AbiGii toxin family protein [Ohessyouella blattaphilus]MCR8562302.1 nucleotidyl transferase AbiEii/AbiGii toxin family protein [Ohessyouella blattaphilus]MDL2249041.1 nucleotidyl transferase AbiEii/AbiGii toxin family protein [Lachnospiraceae bacterium OttesenSCG-928-J05]
MIKVANLPTEERRILFLNTGEKIGMHPSIVEKDFWVCYMLGYLFERCLWKDSFVFKGGTSLSKAYHVINRFSEDIDLIMDWRLIDYDINQPWEMRSKTQQDKLNKRMNVEAEIFLKDIFLPQLISDLHKELNTVPQICIEKEGNEAIVNFAYPQINRDIYLRPEIRMEIGPLAEWTPSHFQNVKSFVAEQYSDVFDAPEAAVRTVDIERTFWEKITILHKVANRQGGKSVPHRYARHYYDVFCMCKTDIKQRALDKKELLAQDIAFKSKFYYSKGAAYETAKIGTLQLLPNEDGIRQLADDYEHMKNMIYGEIPHFSNIVKSLRLLEEEINKS